MRPARLAPHPHRWQCSFVTRIRLPKVKSYTHLLDIRRLFSGPEAEKQYCRTRRPK